MMKKNKPENAQNLIKQTKLAGKSVVSGMVFSALIGFNACAAFPLQKTDDKEYKKPTHKELSAEEQANWKIVILSKKGEEKPKARLENILFKMRVYAPFIAEALKKYGMTLKFDSKGSLASYSELENRIIKVNPKFAELLGDYIAKGLIKDDVDLSMSKTIAHEMIHKLQDAAGIFADIKNLKPSEYVIAANFLEMDAHVKSHMHCHSSAYKDVEQRDKLINKFLNNWVYASYSLHNMRRFNYNNPDGRVIWLEEIIARAANVGDPSIAGYSPETISKISKIIWKETTSAVRINFNRLDQEFIKNKFPNYEELHKNNPYSGNYFPLQNEK